MTYAQICAAGVEWYERHGLWKDRIRYDRAGVRYVVGDWSWNRLHPNAQEWVDDRMVAEAVEPKRVGCEDCGKPYDCFPLDANVSDDLWERIMPGREGGGILCANCIVARLSKLPHVTAAFISVKEPVPSPTKKETT